MLSLLYRALSIGPGESIMRENIYTRKLHSRLSKPIPLLATPSPLAL